MRRHLKVVTAIKKALDEQGIGKLVFLCLSGAHSYGWATERSDYDYRGIFVADTNKLLGLDRPKEQFQLDSGIREKKWGDNDVVLTEIGKAMNLILRGNSNVMEWFNSEVVYTTPESLDLKMLVDYNLTKQVYYAYKGMATENYKKYILQGKKTTKKYLYIIRALMSGANALTYGKIEPNLLKLNFNPSHLDEIDLLFDAKSRGKEPSDMTKESVESLIGRLFLNLDIAYQNSKLPEKPDREAFNRLLLRIRRES